MGGCRVRVLFGCFRSLGVDSGDCLIGKSVCDVSRRMSGAGVRLEGRCDIFHSIV